MQPSSFVFVAIVALWAAYLLPQWIRRRDALGASRGGDRHSLALRVLERRRHRRRPGPSSVPLLPTAPAPMPLGRMAPSVTGPPAPVSSAGAARRRAIVLAVLVTATVLATAAAVAGIVPTPLATLPAGLLVADLAALRASSRARSRRSSTAVAQARGAVPRARVADAPARAAAAEAPSPAAVVPVRPDAAGTVAEELVSGPVEEGTWVPVPVPPPTYTLKPMAPRPEPAPLETLVPAARPAASASGPPVLALPSVPAARASRPWVEGPADVDLDSVLQRRRAVNG